MSWWLKTRAAAAFVASVLVTAAFGMLADDAELPIPVLTGQSGRFLVGHLITVLPAAVLMYGMGRTDLKVESVASRPVRVWNAALGVAAATVGALAAGLLYLMSGNEIAAVLGRNTVGYIGIAMFVASFVGPRAAAVVTAAVPLVCAATGWAQGGQPEPWAWVLQPAQSVSAVAAAVLILAIGTVTTLLRSTPLRMTSA
ncbi:hypothetical protein [Streptomyces sp. SYSU K217416]